MTPVQSALDHCLTLMSRAAPHPMDADIWHDTIRQASITLARSAADEPPRKSFWIAGSIYAMGATLGYIIGALQ